MSAVVPRPSLRTGRAPLEALAFALRNWIAMMLALGVAFWLQLDGAASAATCVAILSLQTRGQAMQKATYRLLGTAVGVLVSIVIAGIFDQTRYLFFFACCGWLALCVTMAGLLDGNRAYGAVLSGYTVAIVALPNIDTPLQTFMAGVNTGAAIMIGVVAVAIVNDLTFAPNLFPTVLARLNAAHARVIAFAVKALQTGATPIEAAAAFKELTGLHSDMTALPAEALRGRAHFEAASLAAVTMVRAVSAAHVVAASLDALGEAGDGPREDLVRALQGKPHEPVLERAVEAMTASDPSPTRLIAASACLALFEQNRAAIDALDAMRRDRRPALVPHLALYRSQPVAVRDGIRAFLALAISAIVLSLLDWPLTTVVLVQIAILIGLSATNPNPQAFAKAALVGVPLAIVAVGLTEFLVLDGVDQFELLALGMGPVIVVCSLLLSSGKPALYGIGFLVLVFFTVILSPANPQSYNPQSYLFSSLFSGVAVVALFLSLSILMPVSAERRRTWILASARADLDDAMAGRKRRFDVPSCAFRDADRVRQFADLHGEAGDLRHLLHMSELAACMRRIRATLDADRALRTLTSSAHDALAKLDVGRLRSLGSSTLLANHDGSSPRHVMARRTAIDLLLASTLIEVAPRIKRELVAESAR